MTTFLATRPTEQGARHRAHYSIVAACESACASIENTADDAKEEERTVEQLVQMVQRATPPTQKVPLLLLCQMKMQRTAASSSVPLRRLEHVLLAQRPGVNAVDTGFQHDFFGRLPLVLVE